MSVAYYARTSHYLQSIGTQLDRVQAHHKLYKDEGVSGKVLFADRPMGRKLLADVRAGKISQVTVLRIDRLGRDCADMLNTIKEIHKYKVAIVSLQEGITTLINGKENPMSTLLCSILSSISDFEYHRIKEKTLEGIARGKTIGVYKGRKKGAIESDVKFFSKPKVKKVQALLRQNLSIRNICHVLECSPNFVNKVKARSAIIR